MYPFLDMAQWSEWRGDLVKLHEHLSGMLTYQTQDAARAATSLDKWKARGCLLSEMNVRPNAPDFREATTAVALKYVELDLAMRAYAPYSPLALTFFEPANSSERYHWLLNLRLSYPIAIIKVVVGGSLGVLAWVLKRDEDMIEICDCEELEEARRLIEPIVPNVCRTAHND